MKTLPICGTIRVDVSYTIDNANSEKMMQTGKFRHNMLCGILLAMIFGLGPVLMAFGKKETAMRMNSSALPLRKKNMGIGLGTLLLAAIVMAVSCAPDSSAPR